MTFELPALPFAKNALAPYISEETIDFHYGKHHQAYVDNLNKLIVGTEFENKTLPDIVKTSAGAIFNNAAQVWNHTFYWNCLRANSDDKPSTELMASINKTFDGLEKFKEAFTKTAAGLFGSGWVWLVKDVDGNLLITSTSNANNPLTSGQIPLLTCDVWEHAYYIDYRNARARYLESFWRVVNWGFVSQNFMGT
ncbi:MAG: Superoxide dismutase [uncultured bacterium]|nr:MAG: Superoxide dismutase [uncultured bacterium]